ncbi:hypothetical protein G7Y89_g9614 [Cudoniella acicularis]|uniref:Serine aminopeptidase S33 domain-containing protein n=1 Tax=Cudoniella acicularis TaxID=354080 RepID=A0A8H4RI07_9HELO|nr:hypothetical protein G7Y89_g9614 [Cudoniella acicularis]
MAQAIDIIPNSALEGFLFNRQQWATGSVLDDPFYSVDESTANAAPGTLLKVEKTTDTSLFTLPPATALSRFVYQSKDLNGSLIPVSAFILWPYSPRSSPDGFQVVAWSHGTSGIYPDCAPSHIKDLFQDFSAPFQLALQGYVVVATDYAGLGVSKTDAGKAIVHQYLACPSHAHDVFYSVEAARSAFPELSASFVVLGHSQGAGSAWACAQRQAIEPVEGYLGAIAAAPVTRFVNQPEPIRTLLSVSVAPGLEPLFPDFKLSDILTPDGIRRLEVAQQMGGNQGSMIRLLRGFNLLKPGWTEHPTVQKFQEITENGGKAVAGPLLIIHGEKDALLAIKSTDEAVAKTADMFPKAQVEYLRVPGAGHTAALTSTQWIWMDWIAKRFAGEAHKEGVKIRDVKVAMPLSSYQPRTNFWLASATEYYHTG